MKRGERTRREAPPVTELNPAQKMGRRLREARLRLSMTQSEVAGDQFSVSYISAVERGQIRPSLGALEQLSDKLDVPLAELVSDERLTEISAPGGREALAERRQEEAEARLRLARVQIHQGKRAEALETLRAINVAHLASHNALERSLLLSACYIALGRLEEARREALDGVAMAERAGDEEMRARLRSQLGAAYLAERKTQLALEQYHQAYESAQHAIAPDPLFRLDVLYNLGVAHWMLSEIAEATTYLREAVDLTDELNNPERVGDACWALSVSYTGQGDARRAKLYAQRALASYEQAETHSLTARAYTRLGRVTAQANKFEEALSLLNQAQTMTEREQDARGQSEVQRSLAAVFVSQKRPAEAKAAASAALALAQSAQDDVLIAEAQLALAQVLDAQGQPKDAEASFEQAIALLEKSAARQYLGDAYAAFSTFLDARGQSKRALEVLRQAWNIREGTNA
jgi:tetratricopeptide (TPR) repeat protein